jgi:hypothetical protein
VSEQPKKPIADDQPPVLNGKDEMNLVDFPFATLNHKDSRTYIECVTWQTDPEKGRYQQKWIASGNSVLGLPHEIADQTVIALILIWNEQGAQRAFSPTIYRILKILRLPDTKHYYDLMKKTLLQLDGMRFRSERAFWDNQKRQHVSIQSFGLFDSMRLTFWIDGDSFNEAEGKNYIEWSTPIWSSLKAGYLKAIDLSFYLTLNRPLTRRLYRFLDKQLRYRRNFEIDIFTLASRLGMQSYAFPSKVQEKLKPAIDELIASGFLSSSEFRKVGKYFRVYFAKATGYHTSENQLEEIAASEQADLFDEDQPETWQDRWKRGQERYKINDEEKELWKEVLTNLKGRAPATTFDTFIESTLLLSAKDGTAIILVGNPHAKDWLQNRFLKTFKDELNISLRSAGKEPLSTICLEVMEAL